MAATCPAGRRWARWSAACWPWCPSSSGCACPSLDPVEVDDELVALFGTEPRLMPHVHLSVQAGDDAVLKRMARRHRRDDVIELARRLRAARPGLALGADLIVGFPGESDDAFANSLGAGRRGRA